MPVIPSEPKLSSIDVPGASTNPLQSQGQTGTALAHVGNALMSDGISIVQKQKEAEAVSFASQAHAQAMLDSQDKYDEIKSGSVDGYVTDDDGKKISNPDGTQRSITQEYRDWANDRYQKDQLAMPSQMAQQMYQQKGLDFFTGQTLQMGHDEGILSAQAAKQSDAAIGQGFSDKLVSNADVGLAYQYSNTLSSSILDKAGGIYEHPEAQKEVRDWNAQLAESTMKGAYNQVLSDARSGNAKFNRSNEVAQWRAVLAGEDAVSQGRKKQGLPTISDMLNPDKKAALDKEFIQLGAAAHEMDMSNFHTQMRDNIAYIQMGKGGVNAVNQAMGQISQMAATGKLKPAEAADQRANVIGAQALGLINTTAFAVSPVAQQDKIIEEQAGRISKIAQASGGGVAGGAAAEKAFRDQARTVIRDSLSDKQKDFASFAERVDPSVGANMANLNYAAPVTLQDKGPQIQAAINKTQLYYDHNFPNQPQFSSVISKDRSEVLGKTLKDPTLNSEQAADAVTALTKAYGPHYPALIDQMIKRNDLGEEWRMASFLPPGLATQDVVSAIKDKNSDTAKNLEPLLEAHSSSKIKFEHANNAAMAPWIEAFSAQGMAPAQLQTLQDVVRSKASALYIQGGGGVSIEDANKNAASLLLEKNIFNQEVARGDGTLTRVLIPKNTGTRILGDVERDQIVHTMSGMNTAEGLKGLGVLVPPPPGGFQSPGMKDKMEAGFYDQAANSGRFVLNPNQQGYSYRFVDQRSGREVPAMVQNPRGGVTPLVVPLSKLMAPTPDVKKQPPTFRHGQEAY